MFLGFLFIVSRSIEVLDEQKDDFVYLNLFANKQFAEP